MENGLGYGEVVEHVSTALVIISPSTIDYF